MIYDSRIETSKYFKIFHNISGFECCFSNLESIHCNNYINDNLQVVLKDQLIKHADTIKLFLAYFGEEILNLSLLILKILKVRLVSPNIVTNIIENTNGNLSEISLVYDDYDHDDGIKRLYKQYVKIVQIFNILLKLSYKIGLFISELEISLTSCQFYLINLDHVKIFLNNWKDRNPMLLKLYNRNNFNDKINQQLEVLAKEYKAKGIIKKYIVDYNRVNINEDFEWN
ncbi:hypothetical protein RhiirA4_463697 [Rhizophagus irregularis]|uniref:Uncharacterized protein n=1 Tax=Rhizophagus irregularis TaxID=588596 RepID=A0A2I1GNG5_9GLOM|nr:hypothetical protein RhiirA4_463697 [Rhizophagus irregularis]